MNEPWSETKTTETGYGIGEPRERIRVIRVLDDEALENPDDMAKAIRQAAAGLVAAKVEITCPCDRMNNPEIVVTGWLP